MPEDYSEDDYGQETYGGDIGVIVDGDFIEYFPAILPRDFGSVFRRYIEAYGDSFAGFDEGMAYVKFSHFVGTAKGDDLDQVGEIFGALGARGNRNDKEYRTYLGSLVQSFSGRGTVPGLKFAIASAVNTDPDNIIIVEDFANNEYTIQVKDVDSEFLSGVINNLAQLADPSGVELSEAPVIITEGDELLIDTVSSTVIDTVTWC